MTVMLELKPEVEAAARAEAEARGIPVEEFLQARLEETVPGRRIPTDQEMAEFEADLGALAEGSEDWPRQPPDAFSRKNIYADMS